MVHHYSVTKGREPKKFCKQLLFKKHFISHFKKPPAWKSFAPLKASISSKRSPLPFLLQVAEQPGGGVHGVRPFSPTLYDECTLGGGGCSANCRRNGRGDLFDDILALRGAKLFQAGGFLKWDMKCFLNRRCIQNFVGSRPLVTKLWCTKVALGGMYKC